MAEPRWPEPSGRHVTEAASVCSAALEKVGSERWSTDIPDLNWTVARAVAHAAESCLWYAIDFAARGTDLLTVEHQVRFDREPSRLVATVRTYVSILADVLDSAPDAQRGFHPMGLADRSGFAAMACDELLVHTWDAANALGVGFDPPVGLAEATLLRLFPWAADTPGTPWRLSGRQTSAVESCAQS
jgi:uncharacterized protein (TIGR03083 family)